MKKEVFKTSLFSVLLFLGMLPSYAQGFGDRQLFNDNWRFHLGDIKYGGKEYMDISSWEKVTLPHDWTALQTASPQYAACTGFLPGGVGWYRKEFTIPETQKGKKVYIYFEGVYNNSEVFVNGKWLGIRPNGYISFMYDMTPWLKSGQNNTIAVRVNHSDDADSRWYTGSGIYRNVRIVYADPVHLDLWGVFYSTETKGNSSSFSVHSTIRNTTNHSSALKITQELFDRDNKPVASVSGNMNISPDGSTTLKQNFRVSSPHFWNLDDPYLYTLKTKVYSGSTLIDSTSTKAGIRTLSYDPDKGFALNGVSMKMKGVCIHHDAGTLGSAVPKEVWLYRLKQLKAIGCNAIRMSHNPESNELFEACDELGFLVMAEAFDEWEYPKKKWLEGWNVGQPGFQGSAQYFREWGKQDLRDMILRDRNHTSIVMWSIGNEVDYPNDPYSHPVLNETSIGQQHTKGYLESQPRAERLGDIAKELVAVARLCDTSRPITAALAGAVMSNYTDYPGKLDVVGYNYTEDRYKQDHEKYPKRILYGSETRHDPEAWIAVRDNPFIFGQFVWTGFDYLGEAGVWPSRGFMTGMIDLAGNIKPRGYFRRALWSVPPVAYLGTYPENQQDPYSMDAPHVWNYEDKQNIRVVCYANGDEAELLLNGKIVGARQKYNDNMVIFGWTIPYEAGTLEVKSYKNNQMVATDKIESIGLPYALQVELTDGNGLDRQQTALVMVNIIDSNGRIVPLADNDIRCELKGNGIIKGTENGQPAAVYDNYHDLQHRAYQGKLLVYVQATDSSGEIILKLTSPLLKNASIRLR